MFMVSGSKADSAVMFPVLGEHADEKWGLFSE